MWTRLDLSPKKGPIWGLARFLVDLRVFISRSLSAFVTAAPVEGTWLDERQHGDENQAEEDDQSENLQEQHQGIQAPIDQCCRALSHRNDGTASGAGLSNPRALAHEAKRMYYGVR